MRRTFRWISIGAIAFVALMAALTFLSPEIPLTSTTVRKRIVEALSERLNADVTLDAIRWRVFPTLEAQGHGLVIRHHEDQGNPPLITVRSFAVKANLMGLVRKHIAHVQVNGLDIQIPPSHDDGEPDGTDNRERRNAPDTPRATTGSEERQAAGPGIENGIVIDTLDSDDARLIIIPADRGKSPRTWAIHRLRMHDLGMTQAMPFQATLTNAVPPGEIETAGTFGPWDRDTPGNTPLSGNYTFEKADLGVFHGIAGTLASTGHFGGALNWIDVNGETDTPDFVIKVGGHPFALHATFHTIVDGTNGDTRLERIDASFLKSSLTAHGSVLDAPGPKGRTVKLDVTMTDARIEDVMTMAVKTPKAPMSGGLRLTTKFVLPPGETDVVDRLKLDGRFSISHARFTNFDVQGKINELSSRGRGKPEEVKNRVFSNFEGRFVFGNGRLSLPDLTFGVPGAAVKLAGHYSLRPETLDFRGNLLMDAKISQTQTGFKSLLLKIVDPLFRKPGGGSSVPIKIEGTRNDPKFGLDMGRVFKRG